MSTKDKRVRVKTYDNVFKNDEEVWSYLAGYCAAIGHPDLQWGALVLEETHMIIVNNTIFDSIESWVLVQE
jgi:hypothetical protein